MDIDSPPLDAPTAHQLTLPTFSSAFPLPFRVLALVGFALLLWAVNMHVLTLLGVDVAWAADLGGPDAPPKEEEDDDDDDGDGDDGQVVFDAFDTDLPAGAAGKLIDPPVRPSFDGYGRMIGNDPATPTGSRAVFTFPTPSVSEGANFNNNYNEDEDDDRPTAQSVYRGVYALFLVYTLYVGCAWLAFRLVTTPSPSEIASTVLRLSSDDHDGSTRAAAAGQAEREKMERYRALVGVFVIGLVGMGLGTGFGWGRWKVGERERRSFLRSFRRILLPPTTHAPFFADVILADILTSFAKVLGDVVVSACQVWSGGITKGRVRVGGVGDWVVLGMVSLLAVIINSTYSFWWDVTNDWGLTLLQPETWSPAPGDLPTTSTMAAIDFSLRFTWSLKLSSHLHTIAEIESGVFMMEALELLRRWMWVFLRTEWEVVKKMEEAELLRGGGGRRGRRQGRAEEERYWRQQQHHQAKIATARARAVDNMGEKQAGPGPF
ncbi:hypothetical protein QFC19_002472 [Naganishia cerealis]|uniref:Uncharacterized protein n=1 Tax=Naganishia cerealis TaxID=610337 RepID=A0ACC2WAT3_9TREE|nr:hypothetical protein QFC19_002472 [Naganishia cerealis]